MIYACLVQYSGKDYGQTKPKVKVLQALKINGPLVVNQRRYVVVNDDDDDDGDDYDDDDVHFYSIWFPIT